MSTTPTKSGSGLLSARNVLAVVLLILALIFVFSNTSRATLHFLGLHWGMPGWVWFIVLLLGGVVIGSLWPWGNLIKRTKR